MYSVSEGEGIQLPVTGPEYETGEIVWTQVGGVFRRKCYFWLRALGPKGEYKAGRSETFMVGYVPQLRAGNKEEIAAMDAAYSSLVEQLLQQGWEALAVGQEWYSVKFRRPVAVDRAATAVDRATAAHADAVAGVIDQPADPPATTITPAPELVITKEPGTVPANSTATVSVRAAPGARCSISVMYRSGPTRSASLKDKTADEAGNVSWTWTVGQSTTAGEWPVRITCGEQMVETIVIVH